MKKFLAIYVGMASTPKGSEWHSTKLPQGCLRIIRTSRSFPATRSRSWNACRFRGSHSTGNVGFGSNLLFL
jgi:hypothetical protein